ncbi:hypothetical protein FN846DRAFT_954377 [Sphaerosporella brunnea]|uniref:Uncharacterized protein n=1 Tax=Sphaerosporella brunnea TaxID=1250544 RepID=A0A5J5ETY4_9PEZI|nr:hypothetical protein FN846DRAFT_954377 [Sphaerosporella brunnea]
MRWQAVALVVSRYLGTCIIRCRYVPLHLEICDVPRYGCSFSSYSRLSNKPRIKISSSRSKQAATNHPIQLERMMIAIS